MVILKLKNKKKINFLINLKDKKEKEIQEIKY